MALKNKIARPIKKVLIALDYEESANKVASEGYALAHNLGAEVVLLHVVNDPVYYSALEYSPIIGYGGMETRADYQQITEVDLVRASNFFLDKMKNHLGEENIAETITEEGDFPEAILDVAHRIKADLIVLGSHSRRGLEKILVGSITDKVLNSSNIPLFIVPVKNKVNFPIIS
jgi:nucleotide-binding universal stress UspA family protein